MLPLQNIFMPRASWFLCKNPAVFACYAVENRRIFFMPKRQITLDAA